MSETNAAPTAGAQPQPPLVVNLQYVKDLSFEVPNAPQVYAALRTQPHVNINLDVQVRRIQEGQSVFEVTLAVRAEATEPPTTPASNGTLAQGGGGVVFIAELAYSGIFTLNGVPEQSVEPVLVVECPRLLFPYARNILADVTRDGGFPPVMLQPIDFLALWQQRQAQGAQPAANA